MIDLYMWTTDNGYKARIVMEETGLEHTIRPIELSKKQQMTPEYRKISPGHKIPAIVDHDGPGGTEVTLCESGAILKYAAEKSGKLYPTDPVVRVAVDQWLFYASATFTSQTQALTLFLFRLGEDVPLAKAHFLEVYKDMLDTFNTHLGASSYLAGDDFTIADIAAFPDVHQHERIGVDLADYPNLKRWHDAVAARPGVTRAYGPLPS